MSTDYIYRLILLCPVNSQDAANAQFTLYWPEEDGEVHTLGQRLSSDGSEPETHLANAGPATEAMVGQLALIKSAVPDLDYWVCDAFTGNLVAQDASQQGTVGERFEYADMLALNGLQEIKPEDDAI